MIREYNIAFCRDWQSLGLLQKSINTALADGFDLYGHLQYNKDVGFWQVLVKWQDPNVGQFLPLASPFTNDNE